MEKIICIQLVTSQTLGWYTVTFEFLNSPVLLFHLSYLYKKGQIYRFLSIIRCEAHRIRLKACLKGFDGWKVPPVKQTLPLLLKNLTLLFNLRVDKTKCLREGTTEAVICPAYREVGFLKKKMYPQAQSHYLERLLFTGIALYLDIEEQMRQFISSRYIILSG